MVNEAFRKGSLLFTTISQILYASGRVAFGKKIYNVIHKLGRQAIKITSSFKAEIKNDTKIVHALNIVLFIVSTAAVKALISQGWIPAESESPITEAVTGMGMAFVIADGHATKGNC